MQCVIPVLWNPGGWPVRLFIKQVSNYHGKFDQYIAKCHTAFIVVWSSSPFTKRWVSWPYKMCLSIVQALPVHMRRAHTQKRCRDREMATVAGITVERATKYLGYPKLQDEQKENSSVEVMCSFLLPTKSAMLPCQLRWSTYDPEDRDIVMLSYCF